MKIKKNDFIELEYTARIKQTNQIFDLTDEKVAKENNIHNPKAKYGPVIICVEQHDLVPGLDHALIDKEPGSYTINLNPEEAFGLRDAKLIKLIPMNNFKKKEIYPYPGLQVNIDNMMGIVRSVSSGRVIVDFNHPLAGKAVIYDIKILRIIENDEEKLQGFSKLHFDADAELKEGLAYIKVPIPKALEKPILDKLKQLIPGIKELRFDEVKNKK